MREEKRLGKCQAWIIRNDNPHNKYYLKLPTRKTLITTVNYSMLKSYGSIVAFFDWDRMMLYLLPRFGYSATTYQHLHKFMKTLPDFVSSEYNLKEIRRGDTICIRLADGFKHTKNGELYRW